MASPFEGSTATPIPEIFRDRRHGGRVLASLLRRYAGRPDLLVLALPRGLQASESPGLQRYEGSNFTAWR